MTRSTKVFLFVFLFFISCFSTFGQTKGEKVDLITYLKQVERKYNIRFSYADANLKEQEILLPDDTLNLDEIIAYLNAQTTLSFRRFNNNILVVKKQSNNTLDISKTQELKEVIVTNYLTKGIALKNDGTTRISTSSFGILPGLIEPDVLQTIQALPGVQSVDERVSNVNIRGGTHDQNLILWDGIKMYQSGHFFGLISAFNPYLTEEVILSKNGTSAQYGDGVSSVIDMRSSNEISDVSSFGGGFNLINADAYAKVPINSKLEAQLSVRRSLTDLIITPTYDQYFKRIFQDTDLLRTGGGNSVTKDERFYFYDTSLKLLYDLSKKDKIRANFLYINNSLTYNEQAEVNNFSEALTSELTQRNLAASVDYSRLWNSKLSTYIKSHVSQYTLDATNYDVINNQRLIQENQVIDNGLKIGLDYNFLNNLKFNLGYQFTEVGISNLEDVNNPPFRSYIKRVVRTHALFNEYQWTSDSYDTHIKFGVRANYFEKFSKTLVEPRLSFNQRFLNYFTLEVLGEFKSQTTSQIIDLQKDFLGIEKRRWVLSDNDEIPIIKSKQVSAGIRYKKNGLIASIEGYLKKVDGITTRSQGFQNQYQFFDAIGNYQIKGLDFLINKQFETSSVWLSYTYSKNDYTFKDLNFNETFPNNADIRHALTFAGTYTLNRFKFALGVNWRSGKPFTEVDSDNPFTNNFINYEAPNGSNLSDYFRTDFSTTYAFKIGSENNAHIGFSLWNVLNRKNIINAYYVIDADDMVSKVENISLGITPNFSFRLKF